MEIFPMPPAIVAVAAVAAAYGATTLAVGAGLVVAGSLAATAVFVGTAMVTSFVGNSLIGQSTAPDYAAPDYAKGILLNKAGNTEPIPVVYGSRRVGGSRVFMEVSGESNEYLHIVLTLCEGPISAINTVYLNNIASTDAKFSGYVDVYKHLGADDQAADTALMAACPSWTEAHRLRGVAYLYVCLKYAQDVFPSGLPTFTADIDGRTVYDPRDGLIKFTQNPPLCIRDYLTNTRYGRGIPITMIDDTAGGVAANYSDEDVTVGGVTQDRYTCDGVVNIDDNALSNTNKLLTSCRGMLVFSGGLYKNIIDKPESATSFEFTEDNITGSWTISLGTKKNMFNRIRARFYNPDRSWAEDIAPVESVTLRALDNGLMLETQIELPFTADVNTAKQIATINLNQSRQQIVCSFTAFIAGMRCEVGDVVPITHSTPGWTAKKFRILNMVLKNNDEVTVTAREYADAVYNFGTISASDTAPNTNLPDFTTAVPPIDIETAEEFYNTGSDFLSKVILSWNPPPDAFVAEYDVEYKLSSGSAWTRWMTTKARSAIITNLASGQYDFRVRSVNTMMVSSAWATVSRYIFGKLAPPASISDIWAEAAQGGLKLTWTPVTDIDLSHYKIRWTSDLISGAWSNSLDVGIAKTSTITIPVARDGRYLVKAVDTSGNESAAAVAVDTTIPAVLAWNVKETQVQEPVWAGTLNGMVVVDGKLEMDSDMSFDAIADFDAVSNVDYQGSVAAAGTYDTAAIDLGSVQTARCSIETMFQVNSLDDDWDDILDIDAVDNWDGVDNTNAGVIPQIALSQDGAAWGSWQNFIAGDYTARAFKARLQCYSTDNRSHVSISNAVFIVDMPDREESAGDVTCPAGGLSVAFATPFMAIPRIGITAQGLQTGDYYALTNKSVSGFDIIFKNAEGSGVQRTLDYSARGY
jgi:hypothetical protein